MKILAIRIKNLASLEGTTTIDFTSEPLVSAGIFAITGPTGAGKSTLLDALCLALYGKTPRYLQAKETGIDIQDVQGSTISQGDVRGILRDGTPEGFAEVDFVGIDHQMYRANWSVRRARNKADGSMQAASLILKNISTNVDFPGKKAETEKEIERLVGLNFEQFTRSVLLAQGDFTAFMKANKDEKSSLLEKLTGTHIYSEISKKIFENYRNQEQILRDMNIRSQGISIFSDEEIKEIKEEESILIKQIIQLSTEIEALSKEINWHEQLLQYEAGKQIALENLKKAEVEIIQSENRKQLLQKVELAQTTRTWHDALHYNQKQSATQKTHLGILKTNIVSLLESEEKIENEFTKVALHLDQVLEIQKEALPKLATAKKLDILIAEKQKQEEVSATEFALATLKHENHRKELAKKEITIEHISTEIKIIEDWQTKFGTKKSIAENKDLIVSKLLDAEKIEVSTSTLNAEKKEIDEKIIENQLKISATGLDFETLEDRLKTQQKAYDVKSTSALLHPIEKINLKKEATDYSLNETIEAYSQWNNLYDLQQKLEALRQKQVVDKAEFLEKKKKAIELKSQLNVAFVSKETSEKMLQKARLSASENVETLRAELIDNEPCMVCGSKIHPYVLHNSQLEKVLTSLEELHKNNENLYLEIFGISNRLEQECQNLSQNIETHETEISNKRDLLAVKNQAWELTISSKECQKFVDEEKSVWIDTKIKNLKVLQAELQSQIKAHFEQVNQLENDKIELDALKEKKNYIFNEISILKSQLAVYNEKNEGFGKAILENEATNKAIEKTLSLYFSGTEWMEKWKEKPKEFVASLIQFSQEWTQKSELLEHHKSEFKVATASLIQLKNQSKNVEEEVILKTKNFSVLTKDLDVKKAERNLIFEGKSAELMEKHFDNAIDEAQKNVQTVKTNLQQNKVDLATATSSVQELTNQLEKITAEIEKANAKIQKWLVEYNTKFQESMGVLELNELLNFSQEWIDSERKVVQIIAEEKTKATSVLLERTQIFETHLAKKLSERLLEDLKNLHENSKVQQEILNQTKATLGIKIAQDLENKNKMGDLVREIAVQAKVADNWSKINEIIGSSDGKKFRQIAQEYTLENLLTYANLHLKDLTNRYRIERIPNTLGLQVVDQDMGDEIRTVYSLSGGESFLVSLALALGLASLSSSKMKVESLFIDEGFGSLDPNTLNIAMDALERLHNLGRKVGVISHVQEMTERIPVQIKVRKKASGKSLVEIVTV